LLDLELWCTVSNAVSTYVKLKSTRTYPVQKGGGSGDLDSLHRKGAARTSPACERWCYGSGRRIAREGVGFSPCCATVGAKGGDRGPTSREIEVAAAGCRRMKRAQLGPMGKKKLRGAGSSCWRRTRRQRTRRTRGDAHRRQGAPNAGDWRLKTTVALRTLARSCERRGGLGTREGSSERCKRRRERERESGHIHRR
jgi:hypothetical protein